MHDVWPFAMPAQAPSIYSHGLTADQAPRCAARACASIVWSWTASNDIRKGSTGVEVLVCIKVGSPAYAET
jgi:hypothetical protein